MLCNKIEKPLFWGTFNIDLFKPNHKWVQNYVNLGLSQVVNNATRITCNSETLIDHIYTNSISHIIEVSSPVTGCSDHYPVCITWMKKGSKIPKSYHKTVTYRSFANFDENRFLFDLANSPLSNVYNFTDPEEALTFWCNTFLNVYDKHAPFKTKRIKHSTKPPWILKEIDDAICIRDNLLKTKQYEEFRKQRNKVTSMIRKSRKKYFQNIINSNSGKDSKSVWKAINLLTKKNAFKNSNFPKNVSIDELNDHFVNIPQKTVTNSRTEENNLEKLKDFCEAKNIDSMLSIPLITVNEVFCFLTKLKQSSTRGLDNIDSRILKISAPIICDTLTYVYNTCIEKNYFPKALKLSKIIPLHKSGNVNDPSNYRPISILSALSKPLEKHIYKHIDNHISRNNLLHPNQSGFRSHHSCHTAVTNLVDQWLCNINDNQFTGVIFVDFAKAFDVIDHNLLIRKLRIYRFSDNTLSFIESYLKDRMQSVFLNGKYSSYQTQLFGIPQGSILGPLLFSLYINDLPLYVKSSCDMFADDTSLHSVNSDLLALNNTLQENINLLTDWTELNHMSLNDKKTKSMLIVSRQKRQNITYSPRLYIKNSLVEEVNEHKVLGVIIDNNLSWSSHVNNLAKRISQKVFQLSKIKHFLDLSSRLKFYHAFIQSSIDYVSTVYDQCSENILKPLLRVHKRALKTILLKSSTLSYQDYVKLDILPLHYRFEYNKAIMMFRILNGLSPLTLASRFKKTSSRYSNNLYMPKPRLDLFKTSLLYSGSTLWNALPQSIKGIKNINSFKKAYKQTLFRKCYATKSLML